MTPRPKLKRKTLWQRSRKVVIWAGVLGLAAAIVYGFSTTSGVAFTDADLHGVDFTVLSAKEKRTALQEANRARCPCSCAMSLAQCVATDSTCPLRTENLGKIRTMVAAARGSS